MMNQFIPQKEKNTDYVCVCVYRGSESICPAGVFALYRQMSVRLFPKLKRWALIIGRDITKICDKIKKKNGRGFCRTSRPGPSLSNMLFIKTDRYVYYYDCARLFESVSQQTAPAFDMLIYTQDRKYKWGGGTRSRPPINPSHTHHPHHSVR